jgi:hypothetical protein
MNDEDDPDLPAEDDPALLQAIRDGHVRKESFWVEENDEGYFWPFKRRSPGEPFEPLADLLDWVLEQLEYSNVEVEEDQDGAIVSMTLGRSAAHFQTEEEAMTFVRKRAFGLPGIAVGRRGALRSPSRQ